MKISSADSIAAAPVEASGARNVQIRVLIGPGDGAPNFNMRRFDLSAGGCTPRHTHPWEHEIYVLAGAGRAVSESGERPIRAGDCIFVPAGELHQFKNSGADEMRLLCLVPRSATA